MTNAFRAALLVCVFALACAPPADPAATYRAFSEALERGDAAKAWAMLSQNTRDELTRAARTAAEARHRPAPKDGLALAFGEGNLLVRKVRRVEVEKIDGDRARVLVTDDKEGHETVTLVREDGAWRVDLVQELSQASAP